MDSSTTGPAHKAPADSQVTLAHIMSEHDTNLYGTIHGGVIMKLIDDAAAAAAGRHAGGPAVTVSVDRMTFLTPVHAGDLLSVHASVEYAGRTSMDVGVRATAERWNASGPTAEVATARLTFVAIDEHGAPRPVPELRPVTAEEHRRHLQAVRRRALRADRRTAAG
ncbi:acyl-CoA thioesterase [Streptomyces sp. NPDC052396]|uniref:acyl-CoA thioesterase n=1 Tax=Streptomyces sp. NPDC052396 TaxID=3365689 RepID=UPI0037D68490